MQIDETLLSACLIDQLRSVLPPADILKQVKECSEKEFNNMVEGEQVFFIHYIINLDNNFFLFTALRLVLK